MISAALYTETLKSSLKFLKDAELLKQDATSFVGTTKPDSKKVAKSNRHTDIYQVAIENRDYSAVLIDDSILQFFRDDATLRYAYIQNPLIHSSKEDYLNSFMTNEEISEMSNIELNTIMAEINENEYEQYLNEQAINTSAHLIRYDFSSIGYSPLVHSYSHFHIGPNPNVRIPCSRVLTPLSFILFVIKHTYYKDWKLLLNKVNGFQTILESCKNNCSLLDDPYWHSSESLDLYLS